MSCKLCLVGEPGVGKTSLVQRLLHDRFPAQDPGPGIRVLSHRLTLASRETREVTLWDVAGYSALDCLNQAFLTRVNAIAAVADAQTPSSVRRALALLASIRSLYPAAAAALWLNKRDLAAPAAVSCDVPVFEVCARDGNGVLAAFTALVESVATP